MLLEILQGFLQPVTLFVFTLILGFSWYLLPHKQRRLPPGPRAWPLLANIPYVRQGNKSFSDRLMDLYREFGEIATLKIGKETLVFVFGAKMIHKACVEQNEDFKFRPEHLYAFKRVFNKRGIVFANGDVHTFLRKFTVVALKEFGVGKRTLEERIHEESEMLVDIIQKTGGEQTCFDDTFTVVFANIISSIMFGARYEYHDNEFKTFLDQLTTAFVNLSYFMPENYLPMLVHFPGSKLKSILKTVDRLKQFIHGHIQDHKQSFDPNNIRDFVDMFLQSEASNDEQKVTEDDVFSIILDTFNGGVHTGSAALLWGILYLTNHPQIQEKCRNELEQVIGEGRMKYFQDKSRLPYLAATINETLRLSGDVSLAVRAVLRDTKFAGYDIPKNSIVIIHLYSAMMDPKFWHNPEEFHPDRFLDNNGELDVPKLHFIPFGLGGKACTGEDLSKMQLTIILGTLLQRFRFESPDNEMPLDSTRNADGVVVRPVRYSVCAKPV